MAPKKPPKAKPKYDPEADADKDGVSKEETPKEAVDPSLKKEPVDDADVEGGVSVEEPKDDELGDDDDDLFDDLPELEDEDVDDQPGGEDDVTKEIAEAAEGLAKMGIVVDPALGLADFMRHLCTALKTHHATNSDGTGDPNADPMNPNNRTDGGPTMATEEPQVVALSMQQQLVETKSQLARTNKLFAEERARSKFAEIDGLVATGKASPAQAKRWKESLGAKQMSLVTEDGGLTGTLAQIEAANETPEGTFWSPEERTQRQTAAREEPGPDWGEGSGGADKNGEPDEHVIAKLTGGEYKPRVKKE